jgi:hypothetical protein
MELQRERKSEARESLEASSPPDPSDPQDGATRARSCRRRTRAPAAVHPSTTGMAQTSSGEVCDAPKCGSALLIWIVAVLAAFKNIKNRGNELKDLLQRKGITEIAASKRTHFGAENAAIDAEPKPRRGDLTQPRPAAWVDGRLANPSPVGAVYRTRNERAPSGLGAGIDIILLAHPGRWPGLC